jgi:N-methylhydantoinase A
MMCHQDFGSLYHLFPTPAVAKLMGSWPVIVPPSPGLLCAFGDATTRTRTDCSRSFVKRFSDSTTEEVLAILK